MCRKPTTGMAFSLSQDFAGFGGNLKFIKTEAQYRRLSADL